MGKAQFLRVKTGDGRRSELLENVPYFMKNAKIPLKAKCQAKELELSVQDYITLLILKDLEDGK
jgi:hypothetical protein